MKNWIYGSLIAALGSVAKAAKAPWWALLLLGAGCLGFATLTVVFPQDSRDRLLWWQDRRARKAERGSHTAITSKHEAKQDAAGPDEQLIFTAPANTKPRPRRSGTSSTASGQRPP